MEFLRTWVLRGPNLWARVPVFEIEVTHESQPQARLAELPGARERLAGWLPELAGRLPADATLADVFQQSIVWLQRQAGSPVSYGLVKPTPRCLRVVVEYEEEALARAAIEAARDLCLAIRSGGSWDPAERTKALRDLAHEVRLGPSTQAIVAAARQRGIPYRRLNDGSLVQLGWGVHQRRIYTAATDCTSSIAEAIAQDKELTRALLRAVGVPVPEGRPVRDAEDAWLAAQELGVPVVVKPRYGNHGRGVTTNLTTREQVEKAYAAAREESAYILVETFAPGADHRLLVIGTRLAAAARREPAQVRGDGRSTIRQLIDEVNRDPRRSDGHATALSYIKLDPVSLAVLAEQGYTPESVPAAGEVVLIRRNGNLSTGGTATDVTDQVHPEVAAMAVEAARVVGLDIAGVDVVATDIGRPLAEQRGAVVEVNAGPGLRMHLEPSAGTPRAVGRHIIDWLYPDGATGRIPLVAVTGVNGKTTTTRLIAHLVRAAGKTVGMTCTDGTYINGRRIEARDCAGPRSARNVLLNPVVEAAVFETARGGILREGLGFDRCDVAVVTNIGTGDHLGLRGVDTPEELARVKRVVVEAVSPGGTAVLNAADPLVRAMSTSSPGRVCYFSLRPDDPLVAEHCRGGGRAVVVRDGAIVLMEGGEATGLLPLARVPMSCAGRVPFQVENALAAAAAAWALSLPLEVLRTGLESFRGDAADAPGRFNVLRAGQATVIVDYAHNPSAVAALVEAVEAFPQPQRILVYCASNRNDDEVIVMGKAIGDGFDEVLLYPDRGNNGRADGELNALLRQGLAQGRRLRRVHDARDERHAIDAALALLGPEVLVVIGVESIEESLRYIDARLAAVACASV